MQNMFQNSYSGYIINNSIRSLKLGGFAHQLPISNGKTAIKLFQWSYLDMYCNTAAIKVTLSGEVKWILYI